MKRSRILTLVLPVLMLLSTQVSALAEEGSIDSAGVPIHYEDMGGDGQPVVLIHSFTSSSDMWRNAGFVPSDEFRFVALDLRGHGQSGKPAEADDYGVEMAQDVVRLMDHLGLDSAHVAGYSMGAEVALKLAAEHPDRIRSLVVGGSGWSSAAEAEVYEQVAMGLEFSPSFRELILAGVPPEVSEGELGFLFGAMEAHGIELDNEDTHALAAAAQSMDEIVDLTEADVAGIEVPVLGIASENDAERPNIERLDGVVSDFTLELIPAGPTGDPSLDHLGAILDPTFHDSIVEFLLAQA